MTAVYHSMPVKNDLSIQIIDNIKENPHKVTSKTTSQILKEIYGNSILKKNKGGGIRKL